MTLSRDGPSAASCSPCDGSPACSACSSSAGQASAAGPPPPCGHHGAAASASPRTSRSRSPPPGGEADVKALPAGHRVAVAHGHRDAVRHRCRQAGHRGRRPVDLPGRGPQDRPVGLHAQRRGHRGQEARPRVVFATTAPSSPTASASSSIPVLVLPPADQLRRHRTRQIDQRSAPPWARARGQGRGRAR